MYLGWTKHIQDEKEKDNFVQQIYGSKRVLERAGALLQLELDAIEQTEGDQKAYDNPSWAFKQAFKNGMRKGLNIAKNLVDLDKQQPPKEKQE